MELIELREACQRTLGDADGDTFTDSLVDGWITEAIQEYSQHFNKVATIDVDSIAEGTYAYAITERIEKVVRVEYPLDEDPPQYLTWRPYNSDEFWLNGDSYDFIQTQGEPAGILYISDPTRDDEATITAYRSYDETAGTFEVEPSHEPIIISRVRWSALSYLANIEMLSPTSQSSLLMAQLEQNSRSARAAYFKLLFNAVLADIGRSERLNWEMDKWDRKLY